MFSDQLLIQLCLAAKYVKFTPGQMICKKGELDECSIYFVEKGSCQIVRGENNLRQYVAGESFGEYSFFSGLPRSANIRSNEFSILVEIKRSEFIEILKKFPEDHEKFCNRRDELLFQIGQAQTLCSVCFSKHLTTACPLYIRSMDRNEVK
jgi:CRP-like cAMP-binding protein